jgi:radical SAM superfamily enzyme YgiQ (UPF0313 family)
MKILLIYPYFLDQRIFEDDIRVVPQGLYYIGALLASEGYPVTLLDWHNMDRSPEAVETELVRLQPDIIGCSILNANRWGGIDIARTARRVCPRAVLVFGGVGATHLWHHLLSNFPEIDYIVLGEGEVTFLELIRALEKDGETSAERVDGLALRKHGRPVKTGTRAQICNLDDLPNPAEVYPYQHVALTRGCTHNCTFCGSPRFWNRRVRYHSVDYFVHQLEVQRARGTTFFYFSDDTFTLNRERVIRICRRIIDRQLKITWAAISRIDLISEELLAWMRRAGCIQISYGVESGSPAIRRTLGKHISNQSIQRAFDMTQRYGIMARAYFIYGCPQESDATIQESIDLMHAIKPLSTIFYILDIFPGTKLYADMLERLGADDDIWLDRIEDILYFETDPDLARDQVLEWGRRLRTSFHNHLPAYVAALELVDEPDLYPFHADFLSRLALTFEHGDYARIDAIFGKSELAARLYREALEYHPDARAYLGLGMGYQKSGDVSDAIDVLKMGHSHFPEDPQISICLAVSHLNARQFQQAFDLLTPLDHLPQALPFLVTCCRELGLAEQGESYRRRMEASGGGDS